MLLSAGFSKMMLVLAGEFLAARARASAVEPGPLSVCRTFYTLCIPAKAWYFSLAYRPLCPAWCFTLTCLAEGQRLYD